MFAWGWLKHYLVIQRSVSTRSCTSVGNVMIGGLAKLGCGFEALEVSVKMLAVGVMPDECSFVTVLLTCSHADLGDESHKLFQAMLQDHGIEPTVVHCICIVDLLGWSWQLEEAKLFFDNMLVETNEATCSMLVDLMGMWSWMNLQLKSVSDRYPRMPLRTT